MPNRNEESIDFEVNSGLDINSGSDFDKGSNSTTNSAESSSAVVAESVSKDSEPVANEESTTEGLALLEPNGISSTTSSSGEKESETEVDVTTVPANQDATEKKEDDFDFSNELD